MQIHHKLLYHFYIVMSRLAVFLRRLKTKTAYIQIEMHKYSFKIA